eukprot:178232_1
MADAHEGSHEPFDIILGVLNLFIGIESSLFLIKLIMLYKKSDIESPSQRSVSYLSAISYSTQTNSINESKYVIYFVICGISCGIIGSLCATIFYFESYFTFNTTVSSAIFESMHELFWNLTEIACYCLFVNRLKASFKHTSHRISRNQLIIFRISIAVYLFCVVTFCLYEVDSVSSAFYTQDAFSWIYVFGIETIDFVMAFWLV